ncbi:MAG: hypothetical protein ACK4Y5_20695 [Acetobacteraceae bacterium]|jgi:hypothetical protein
MNRIVQILSSRTVWASIATVVGGGLTLFFKLSPEASDAIRTSVTEIGAGLAVVVGGISAIYFRVNSRADLTPPSNS